MKKALALLLALAMIFCLFACGDSGGKAEEGKKGETEGEGATGASPNMNADGSVNLDKVAHYDANYNYAGNEKFNFQYLAHNADVLYETASEAYEYWCTKYNMNYMGFASANNDSEMFMNLVQTSVDQGVDLLVMDPDITIFPAIAAMLEDYPDVHWMSQMGTPRSGEAANGDMLTCFVGFDYYGAGALSAEKLVEWKEENYPDVPWSEWGFASYTLSVSPPLFMREMGAKDVFLGLDGVTEDQYFTVDVITYGLTVQGAIDGLTPVISTNDQYTHWLIFGLIDDLAMGAATVLDQAKLTETSCVSAIGGPGQLGQLIAGQRNAFRYAYATPQLLYAEPILGALYAFEMGWASPETIWPSWVKKSDCGGEGHNYANLLLPSYWVDENNYQDFYVWTDLYAGSTYYRDTYGVKSDVTIDAYSPYVDVPAGWND